MKDWKLLLGSLMLILALLVIYFNIKDLNDSIEDSQDDVSSILSNTEILPLKINTEFLDLELNESDSLITVIAVLSTKVCPSCVSNTLEFINEGKKRSELATEYHIIFIDESEEEITRFVQVTNLNHPIRSVNSEDIDPFFYEKKQNLIFLNSSSEVFYYLTIPVSHASLTAINNELNHVVELSKLNP